MQHVERSQSIAKFIDRTTERIVESNKQHLRFIQDFAEEETARRDKLEPLLPAAGVQLKSFEDQFYQLMVGINVLIK